MLSGIFAVNNFGNFLSKAFLAGAGARILGVLGKDLFKLFWHDEGEVLEVIFEGFVGLVEPELIEIEDRGLFSIEPNGIAFGFSEFATGNFVDNKRTRVTIGFVIFEALNKVNARGAVAELISAAKLEVNIVGAEKMEEIIHVHYGDIDKKLVENALDAFYKIREMKDLQKRPSTSELLDWIQALMISGVSITDLYEEMPFLGVLLKKNQDIDVFEEIREKGYSLRNW